MFQSPIILPLPDVCTSTWPPNPQRGRRRISAKTRQWYAHHCVVRALRAINCIVFWLYFDSCLDARAMFHSIRFRPRYHQNSTMRAACLTLKS